jgi:hypothetical protein
LAVLLITASMMGTFFSFVLTLYAVSTTVDMS